MTAGEDALREAARLETARVYGSLCPETRHAPAVTAELSELEIRREARAARLRREAIA